MSGSIGIFTMASSAVTALVILSLSVRVLSIYNDPSGFKNVLLIIAALGAGLGVTQILGEIASSSGGAIAAASCEKMAAGWWNCGGWPVIYESIAEVLSAINSVMTAALMVPAVLAQGLAGLYIHRRISSNFYLQPAEILRAFFGGCIVFASLIWLPKLSSMVIELMASLFLPARVEEGKAILSGVIKALASYQNLAEDEKGWGNAMKQGLLMVEIAIPGLILSATAFISILVQAVMLALLPFYVFATILSRDPDKFIVVRICMSYAAFTLFQSLLWVFISLYPSDFATGYISQITLGSAIQALFPIVIVSIMIGAIFATLPVKVALGAFQTLAFVRIK